MDEGRDAIGGSSGIGRGICLGLASEGAIVAILGRNVAQLQVCFVASLVSLEEL